MDEKNEAQRTEIMPRSWTDYVVSEGGIELLGIPIICIALTVFPPLISFHLDSSPVRFFICVLQLGFLIG